MVRVPSRASSGLVASFVGVGLAACTSFGAPPGDTEDASVAPLVPSDGAVVLADGAVVPGPEGGPQADGGAEGGVVCKVPTGIVDPNAFASLPLAASVAAFDAASQTLFVAGAEVCDGDGTRKTAVYRVPASGLPTRIACVGVAFELPLAIDADAGGVVVATRYISGLSAARLYRLETTGAEKAAPASVSQGGRSVHPTAVRRAGANDVWAYYSPAPVTSGVAVATLKVEPGGRIVALGEVPIAALAGGPAGFGALEVDLSTAKVGVRASRWNLGGAQMSRDMNDEPPRHLPTSAPAQPEGYPAGALLATPAALVAGFTVGAQAYATHFGAPGNKPFTVGPVGAATGRAPVAQLCDGSVLLGHGTSTNDRGRVTRFPSATNASVDGAFDATFPDHPAQLFPAPDGTVLVLLVSPQTSSVWRIR